MPLIGMRVRGAKKLVQDFGKITVGVPKADGYFMAAVEDDVTRFLGPRGRVAWVITVSLSDPDYQFVSIRYAAEDPSANPRELECEIPLVSTPCRFGGARFWFLCPVRADGHLCKNRVGVLYKDGDMFACRRCLNLTYKSSNLSGQDKAFGVIRPDLMMAAQNPKNLRNYKGQPTKRHRRLIQMEDRYFSWKKYWDEWTNRELQMILARFEAGMEKQDEFIERINREIALIQSGQEGNGEAGY